MELVAAVLVIGWLLLLAVGFFFLAAFFLALFAAGLGVAAGLFGGDVSWLVEWVGRVPVFLWACGLGERTCLNGLRIVWPLLFLASAAVAHHGRRAVDWRAAGCAAAALGLGLFLRLEAFRRLHWAPPSVSVGCLDMALGLILALCVLRAVFGGQGEAARRSPEPRALARMGLVLFAAALLPTGGAATFLTVPCLLACRVPLLRAIGTAAAACLLPAFVNVGYAFDVLDARTWVSPWNRWRMNVWLLLISGGVGASCAVWGVKLAHSLSEKRLKGAYAVFLCAVAAGLCWSGCDSLLALFAGRMP